jgi:hypothetical protein
MKHIILFYMCEYSDAIKLPKSYSPLPLSPPGGQGLQIKSFLADKIDKYRGKQEVAATVLIQTIKYYENTKYTLRKGINKIRTIVMCLSSSRKCKIFSAQLKCTTNGISVQNVNVLVTFLKFPLTYSMKFIKIYSIK